MDLYNQVLHALEGEEIEVQNWPALDVQVKTGEVRTFGPDRWIKRAVIGRLDVINCLAVILFAVRETFCHESERRIVEAWAVEFRDAATSGEITPRDPTTLLPLRPLPDGWDWLVSMDDADRFVNARGMMWKCSEVVTHIALECEAMAAYETRPKAAPDVVKNTSSNPISTNNWILKIQVEATRFWKQVRAGGGNPTRNNIKGDLATWCRDNEVKTDGGIFPDEDYIYRHVIRKKKWKSPD